MVTGHTGFKGTWLTLLLEHLGIEVVGYSLPPHKDSLYARLDRFNKINEVFADIRDFTAVKDAMFKYKPSAVLHLAAQPLVNESYKTPRETFEVNLMGTVNLLDSFLEIPTSQAFMAITTDKVYENINLGIRFKESDSLRGKDPYSASKVAAEAAVAAWQQLAKRSNSPKIVALRAGNVIGGGDWAKDRLIPDLIRGFSCGQTVTVRNPDSTRPWQHVLDPLVGYLLALDYVLSGNELDSLNFGPSEKSLSVRRVVEFSQEIWGEKAKVNFADPQEFLFEASQLDLDSNLANKILNWAPAWDQAGAIKQTNLWWRELLVNNQDPSELSRREIEYAVSKSLEKA